LCVELLAAAAFWYAAAVEYEEPEPLWRQVLAGEQPWRRGRIFVVLFAIVTFVSQLLALGIRIAVGDIEMFIIAGFLAATFWMLFYFIWIGVHWTRWVVAGLLGFTGFTQFLWSFHNGSVLEAFLGGMNLCMAAYLGAAPAVYFFAMRQREKRDWRIALAVAAVFLLLLGSFGTGAFAIASYRTALEAEGREFASNALRHIYVEHDEEFLLARATERMRTPDNLNRLHDFMLDAQGRLGLVSNIELRRVMLRVWWSFPARMVCAGQVTAAGDSFRGPVYMYLVIGNAGAEWQVDGVWWKR
jgi:hypothetical protein